MKKSAILINGVSLPHHVLDKSLEQAINDKTFIKVVFIYENSDDKDYSSPANIEVSKADLSENNAVKNLEDLVQHNSSYVDIYFTQNDIPHDIIILRNPTIEEIAEALTDSDKIFIDHDTFMHPEEFAYVNFSFEDLEEQIATKIEWCKRG